MDTFVHFFYSRVTIKKTREFAREIFKLPEFPELHLEVLRD